ncbi:MAG: hypothetical protein AAF614_17500 [Chloroflexota bacterium]
MMTVLLADEIKPLVKSLNFPLYLEQQLAYWKEEQRRREAYYDWLEPDVKAEFINGEVIMESPAKNVTRRRQSI